MNKQACFSSNKDDWETPQEFFDCLDEEFGFTLDVCADDFNHKCSKYYTKEQDGLQQEWGDESVWCNPPYGRQIALWVRKCYLHGKNGGVAVMLVPARTDTKWFHNVWGKPNVEIRFVKGRLKFSGAKDAAPFPSMIIVFNGNS